MNKIVIKHKREEYLVYVQPNKLDTFEETLNKAVAECKAVNDKRGLTDHVVHSLLRHGFKVVNLKRLEVRKI